MPMTMVVAVALACFSLVAQGAAQSQDTQKPPAMQSSQKETEKPQGQGQPQQPSQKPPGKSKTQAPSQKPPAKKKAPIQTFIGVISDGQCAAKGSHKEVMQKARVNTTANCVKGCSRRHGYVLYVPSTRKVYKLDDQERPAELAGKRAKIKGALNPQTQTIFVSSIEPAN
jgi:outer membrane biosynthesis protein TonB